VPPPRRPHPQPQAHDWGFAQPDGGGKFRRPPSVAATARARIGYGEGAKIVIHGHHDFRARHHLARFGDDTLCRTGAFIGRVPAPRDETFSLEKHALRPMRAIEEQIMGSIASSLNGLSYLTQPGGLLSSLPASISKAVLQSASPQDVVSLSVAALQTQEIDGIFGISPASQNALPIVSAPATPATAVLPGVSAADLTNATPQQQASINDQALLLQQVQGLYGVPTSLTGTTNLIG
jgi:hypothetical protein